MYIEYNIFTIEYGRSILWVYNNYILDVVYMTVGLYSYKYGLYKQSLKVKIKNLKII